MSAGTSESALVLLNFASRYRTASGPGSQAGNLLGVVDATGPLSHANFFNNQRAGRYRSRFCNDRVDLPPADSHF